MRSYAPTGNKLSQSADNPVQKRPIIANLCWAASRQLKRIDVRLVLALVSLSLFGSAPAWASEAEERQSIDVLFIGPGSPKYGASYWANFQAASAEDGIQAHAIPKQGKIDYDLFTDAFLRQFHVVVFCGLPDVDEGAPAPKKRKMAAFRDRLDAYHRAGGGLMWVPEGHMHQAVYWNDVVGERYDAQSLEEKLYDAGKKVHINPYDNNNFFGYIWTTDIVEHPITEGVEGLLLPLVGQWSWPGTVPMKFGESWTVLVKGMPSTRAIGNAERFGLGKHDFKPDIKGSYDSSPEIVGIRELDGGASRMMVFPFYGTHTWRNFGHKSGIDAMMLDGYGVHSSHAYRLLTNSFKWLAQPALATGDFGGYSPPLDPKATIPEPLDWENAAFLENSWGGEMTWWNDQTQQDTELSSLFTPNGRAFKGIIGARTTASDGQGSVADYVKIAKKQGLSFVVFLEKLEDLDDAGYQQLVAECRAASDESFAAIPGYLYRDLSGLQLYVFGKGVEQLPSPENLTDDRRVKVPSRFFFQYGKETATGMAELGKMELDPNWVWHLTCVAPYAYRGTTRVDDGLEEFLSLEARGHRYAPNALVEVTSPAEMKAAIREGAMLTVVHDETLASGLQTLTLRAEGPHPVRAYITSGPEIQRWGAINPIGHPFFAGKQRARFALDVSSEVGIADVKIINANTGLTLRHFKPGGSKTFSCSIDETHKAQWHLVPIITDVAGNSAVGGVLMTYQDGNRFWMMGERFFGMHHSLGWDKERQKLLSAAGWCKTWGKTWGNNKTGRWPGIPRGQERKIVGIDGAKMRKSSSFILPRVTTSLGTEPVVPAYMFHPRLSSFDVSIMDYDGSNHFLVDKRVEYPKNKGGFWPIADPQTPTTFVDIQARSMAVRARKEADISASIHSFTFTFKQDVILEEIALGGYALNGQQPTYHSLSEGAGDDAWVVDADEKALRNASMPAGGYLQSGKLNQGAMGLINLGSEPVSCAIGANDATFFYDGDNRKMKAGDRIEIRFLAFEGADDLPTTNEWIRKFISDFGIGMDKPGYPFALQQGKLVCNQYIMTIEPEEGGAIIDFDQYELPHNLLVSVDGFEANAVTGRYDIERKQLMILPVLEGKATTSVNLNLGDTKLYMGELIRCDNADAQLSCVQDGVDKLLVEAHNPTEEPLTVRLSAAPGFKPLEGFDRVVALPPFSSEKIAIPTIRGTLVNEPYQGD